jgi:hypothetical protein
MCYKWICCDDLNIYDQSQEITYNTVANRPMRELLKFRNLKKHNCTTVASDVFPYHRFAPHRALLGYAVTTGLRNSKEGSRDFRDVMRNNTQRCVLRMSDSSVYKRNWRQYEAVQWVTTVTGQSDNWEVSRSSPEVVSDKKCHKIVKWIIVARQSKGQINKALNKHSTSYLSRY